MNNRLLERPFDGYIEALVIVYGQLMDTVRTTLRLNGHAFPFLAIHDALTHLLLVQFLLEELGSEFCVALAFDVLQCSQVIADGVLLFSEGLAEVLAQRDECRAHHTVRDDLVVVGLQQEENDAGSQHEVPFLHICTVSQHNERYTGCGRTLCAQ